MPTTGCGKDGIIQAINHDLCAIPSTIPAGDSRHPESRMKRYLRASFVEDDAALVPPVADRAFSGLLS